MPIPWLPLFLFPTPLSLPPAGGRVVHDLHDRRLPGTTTMVATWTMAAMGDVGNMGHKCHHLRQ
jgi:hypothetical protein